MVRAKCGRNTHFQEMYFELIGRDPDTLDIVDANAQVSYTRSPVPLNPDAHP